MRTIGGVFGRPPFGALYEHMLKAIDCLDLLQPMIEHFTKLDFDQVQRLAGEMHRREHEADAIKNEIRKSLSRSIFTAVERSEMMILLKAQDDVSDSCDEVARLLEIRRTAIWPALAEPFMKLARQVALPAAILGEVESHLKDLEGQGYPPAEMEPLVLRLEQLQRDEHEADVLEQALLRTVFSDEAKSDPVSLIFLLQIIRQLGAIANSAENAADVLERMVRVR